MPSVAKVCAAAALLAAGIAAAASEQWENPDHVAAQWGEHPPRHGEPQWGERARAPTPVAEVAKHPRGPTSTETETETVTLTDTSTSSSTRTRTRTSTSSTATSTTATTTTATATTTTATTTTATTTTLTTTVTTTSTSTSTTGPHVFGGQATQDAFLGWLSVWRSTYEVGLWNAGLADPWESLMPEALRGIETKVVVSSGGVAGGIVTEGMGYGLMVEGLLAAKGDAVALANGLSLTKSWLGMVNGPDPMHHPLAGGGLANDSATKVGSWPYGISAVEWSTLGMGPAGVPAWKFPIDPEDPIPFLGSAADGDQDAIMGMVYLAGALNYPEDFVDMVVRSIISFASADLGFPDLYRTLPGGEKVFVPKLGSMWGGLLPPAGGFKTSQQPWCYSPGYFAPAHYRTFVKFLSGHWNENFTAYLPRHLSGKKSKFTELVVALESAVTAGYNIMYYSSCSSGAVSNWVGVEATCPDNTSLNCDGVPWAHTPWVGAWGGQCAQSGTSFGAFGADASRAAWRIAMDYVLFREESTDVTIFDRDGKLDPSLTFGARTYLNRIVQQYVTRSICDGGQPGECMNNTLSPYKLAYAFDPDFNATNVTCANVPNPPESWWAGFMAYPTFTAFVAPYDEVGAVQMANWLDTFASICDFSEVNLQDFSAGKQPKGGICLTSYFEASQAVISTLIMANMLTPMKVDEGAAHASIDKMNKITILKTEQVNMPTFLGTHATATATLLVVSALLCVALTRTARHRVQHTYTALRAPLAAGESRAMLVPKAPMPAETA